MSSHSHKCNKCSTVWSHGDDCHSSSKAHECPKCGELQFWKYKGEQVAEFVQGSCAAMGNAIAEGTISARDSFIELLDSLVAALDEAEKRERERAESDSYKPYTYHYDIDDE